VRNKKTNKQKTKKQKTKKKTNKNKQTNKQTKNSTVFMSVLSFCYGFAGAKTFWDLRETAPLSREELLSNSETEKILGTRLLFL